MLYPTHNLLKAQTPAPQLLILNGYLHNMKILRIQVVHVHYMKVCFCTNNNLS